MTSPAPTRAFVSPDNWCDRICERCPLAKGCLVYRRDQQRRWVHEARREDPNDWKVVMADVADDLRRALEIAQEIAEKDGIDLDAPLPERPIPLAAARLRKASQLLATSLDDALAESTPRGARGAEQDTPGDPSFASARSICLTIAMKAARIGGMLGAHDEGDPVSEEMWDVDAVPNLILLELLRVRFDRVVAEIRARHPHAEAWPRVARARADLDRVLAPMSLAIRPAEREMLEALVASGAAPSPFCMVDSSSAR
jgi:hypothetical protein